MKRAVARNLIVATLSNASDAGSRRICNHRTSAFLSVGRVLLMIFPILPVLILDCILGLPLASAMEKKIEIEAAGACISLEIEQGETETLSCSQLTEISYRVNDCKTRNPLERGTNKAHLSCPDSSHWELVFKTAKGIAWASLKAKREPAGRKGIVVSYVVEDARFTPNRLPEPKILFDSNKTKENP